TRGKSWQYHALSVGYLLFGLETKTWIRNKTRMRKTTTIMTLIHHVETRSARGRRARRTRSFSASSVFALRRSIRSSALLLAGSAMWLFFLPRSPFADTAGASRILLPTYQARLTFQSGHLGKSRDRA